MDDDGIENHPDLMDPDWQRHAEKEAWVDFRRDRRRASRRRRLSFFGVAAVLVVAAVVGLYRWGKAASEQYAPDSANAAPPTTTAPTDLPDVARVDLSRPFDNTPAQNWAEGIAGLRLPSAATAETRSALDQVKQAIALSSLDLDVLERHDTAKYVAVLAPDQQPDAHAHPDGYVVRFADGYHLLPVPPRMNGSLTVHPGKAGELDIHADYIVAYAFDPGSHLITGPADLEPFIRVQADYVLRSGSGWRSTSRGLWLDNLDFYNTDVACAASKNGLVAPEFSETNVTAASLSAEPGRFDPAKPMPTGDNCH
ncbi:hypothetical protein [Amycolatopsis alkalitolerans]|uniref:Uncharacterized protein n=1 Tax=Amycolatopsis alkalitolerans TaxID=2547244 RepID=A0A5C4M0L8_9PSEU|nr:hypothetical protein [Amycolatopsis alkalitolerans]TNC24374.1 hypothetical protein FG385_18300 [Amycolatopsis alkalitolerans]